MDIHSHSSICGGTLETSPTIYSIKRSPQVQSLRWFRTKSDYNPMVICSACCRFITRRDVASYQSHVLPYSITILIPPLRTIPKYSTMMNLSYIAQSWLSLLFMKFGMLNMRFVLMSQPYSVSAKDQDHVMSQPNGIGQHDVHDDDLDGYLIFIQAGFILSFCLFHICILTFCVL